MPAFETMQLEARPSLRTRVLLYAGFMATGVSLAAPGSMMPWLLVHWRLQDDQAGLLLFLFFLGSTLGAFFVPHKSPAALRSTVPTGAIITAVGAVSLAFASSLVAYPAMLLYGVGLGATMTSIVMLQGRQSGNRAVAVMTRLNLLWAVGACLAPWLMLNKGVRDGHHERHVLFALAAGFVLLAVCLSLEPTPGIPAIEPGARTQKHYALFSTPFSLLLMVFCAAGVESSSGSWLAAYSQRSGDGLDIIIGAPTCFWAGLLASRLLHSSSRIGKATRDFLLTWNLLLMAASLGAILVFHQGVLIVAAAFLLGFSAGPVYPLLIALVLENYQGSKIFVLAGIGSASLPLLTGALSSATGALRAGLLVPCAAALAMAVAGWILSRTRASRLDTQSW